MPVLANRRLIRRPILKHKKTRRIKPIKDSYVWLFDLDNTLHDASHAMFDRISLSMNQAVVDSLELSWEEAQVVRQRYWQRFGATVIGMHKYHQVNPLKFLALSHDFDVQPLLKYESNLPYLLSRLPGRKVIVTNAPSDYACRVLKAMGIYHYFDSIWGVEHMLFNQRFRVKPSLSLMNHIAAYEGVSRRRLVLVEDTLKNLKPARTIGIKTVHIEHAGTPFSRRCAGRASYVDVKIKSATNLLRRLSLFKR